LGCVAVAVDADAVAHLTAEQVPDRRSQRLPLDVPERHVDAGHRPGADDAGHAMTHDGAEHLLPELLDMRRILADEHRREILHRALDAPRPAAALADPGDAGVGIDLDEEPVAAPRPRPGIALRAGAVRGGIGLLRRELRLHEEGLDP